MPALYDYQWKGVDHLCQNQRALLLDGMGLGKTAQSITAFDRIGAKNVLIVCPPSTKYGWADEVRKWSKRSYDIIVLSKMLHRLDTTGKPTVVICPYSLLNSPMIVDQLKGRKWGVLVIDEIHYCKSTKSNRQKVVLGRGGLVSKSVYAWGLSGTPMTTAPKDLWPVFRSMGKDHLPKEAQDYNGYHRIFCNMRKTRFGWDVNGAKNLHILKECLYNGFSLRRTKEQVLDQMPDKTYRVTPMEGDTRADIRWGEKLRVQVHTPGMDAGELAEARRELADEKLPAVMEYLSDLTEPTVIFCWHKHVVEHICDGLGGVPYYGDMTAREKEKSKKAFESGEAKFFVANIASAGTGLNGLQHVSSHAVFVECPWNYSDIEQAADRLHRIGQKDNVLVDLLVLRGGIEEYILKTVLKKQKYFQSAIDSSAKSID